MEEYEDKLIVIMRKMEPYTNKLVSKIRKNTGAEYIVSAAEKYRAIIVFYAALKALQLIAKGLWDYLMVSEYQSTIYHAFNWTQFRNSFLALLLPLGIALAIFLNRKGKSIIAKYALITGFGASALNGIASLASQSNSLYLSFTQNPAASGLPQGMITYNKIMSIIGVFVNIAGLIMVVSFLLILVFNIDPKRMKTWLPLIIVAILIVDVSSITIAMFAFPIIFNVPSSPNLSQLPYVGLALLKIKVAVIVGQVGTYISYAAAWLWLIFELLIAPHMIRHAVNPSGSAEPPPLAGAAGKFISSPAKQE